MVLTIYEYLGVGRVVERCLVLGAYAIPARRERRDSLAELGGVPAGEVLEGVDYAPHTVAPGGEHFSLAGVGAPLLDIANIPTGGIPPLQG